MSSNAWICAIKKTIYASEQLRQDVKLAREQWQIWQKHCDPSRLVFLDETGLNTKMARLYGRSFAGSRCFDHSPYGHWKSNTFIAALRIDRVDAPWLIDGAINGAGFLTYISECLCPFLSPGDIVVCDNLASHKVVGVREAIESVGATIRYLPAYSPDLNPIEMLFSKLKAFLRRCASRSLDELIKSTALAIESFCPDLCHNLFKHANYCAI